MPVRQFDVYDIIVDTVPGVVLIFSLLYNPVINSMLSGLPDYGLSGSVVAISVLILSFVTGHLIQIIVGSSLFTTISILYNRVPRMPEYKSKSFQKTIEGHLNNNTQIGENFLRGCQDFFDLELIHCNGTHTEVYDENFDVLFFFVRNYTIGNNVGRARRYLIGKTFFRSLWGVFFISFFFYGIYAASIAIICSTQYMECSSLIQESLPYFSISILFLLASILSQYRFRIYTDTYGKELFNDFYVNVLTDE